MHVSPAHHVLTALLQHLYRRCQWHRYLRQTCAVRLMLCPTAPLNLCPPGPTLKCRPHAVYNDADPQTGKEHWYNAHSKGVIYEHQYGGRNITVWLQHSVPKWPHKQRAFPHAQSVYGQHFFCLQVLSRPLHNFVTLCAGLHVSSSALHDQCKSARLCISRFVDGCLQQSKISVIQQCLCAATITYARKTGKL